MVIVIREHASQSSTASLLNKPPIDNEPDRIPPYQSHGRTIAVIVPSSSIKLCTRCPTHIPLHTNKPMPCAMRVWVSQEGGKEM